MSYDTTIYKIIPFSEVAYGQLFEDAHYFNEFTTNPWRKTGKCTYHDSLEITLNIYERFISKFAKSGCLVRIADCDPVINGELKMESGEWAKPTEPAKSSDTVYLVSRIDAPEGYRTTSTKTHATEDEAKAEALRLAKKHEGCRFAVTANTVTGYMLVEKKFTIEEAAQLVIDAQGDDERNAAIASLEKALARQKGGRA